MVGTFWRTIPLPYRQRAMLTVIANMKPYKKEESTVRLVRALALLLRKDPSGESAVKLLNKSAGKIKLSPWGLDYVWEKAEKLAYPSKSGISTRRISRFSDPSSEPPDTA